MHFANVGPCILLMDLTLTLFTLSELMCIRVFVFFSSIYNCIAPTRPTNHKQLAYDDKPNGGQTTKTKTDIYRKKPPRHCDTETSKTDTSLPSLSQQQPGFCASCLDRVPNFVQSRSECIANFMPPGCCQCLLSYWIRTVAARRAFHATQFDERERENLIIIRFLSFGVVPLLNDWMAGGLHK